MVMLFSMRQSHGWIPDDYRKEVSKLRKKYEIAEDTSINRERDTRTMQWTVG